MKKLITLVLCAVLFMAPIEEAKAPTLAAVCLVLIAVGAVVGVAVIVRSCRPRYYCVSDDETGQQWCRLMDKGDLIRPTLRILSGPYKDAKKCELICATNVVAEIDPEMFTLHLEKSTNLVDWVECAQLQTDGAFEWSETNTVDAPFCYYRAWQSAPVPTH
jgi:hypothetical protein